MIPTSSLMLILLRKTIHLENTYLVIMYKTILNMKHTIMYGKDIDL